MLGFDKIMDSRTAEAVALLRDYVLVRYKPSGVRNTRLIKVVKTAVDPLQPPKHKYRKIPRAGGSSLPPVVMHSPPRQPTAEDLRNWRVPPCESRWKNPKGYVIPLDKRHSAVGWEAAEINHRRMAELSEALNSAADVCREGVASRGKIRREREVREKERRDGELRELARRARDEFGGKKRRANGRKGTKKEKKRRRRSGGIGDSVSGRGELLFDRSLVDAYCHGCGDEDEGEVKTTMKPIVFEREEDADPFGLHGFLSKLA